MWSMVARTPRPRFPHQPHLIPPEILKGLKFKHRSRDRHHAVSVGFLTLGVALAIVDAFAKFKDP